MRKRAVAAVVLLALVGTALAIAWPFVAAGPSSAAVPPSPVILRLRELKTVAATPPTSKTKFAEVLREVQSVLQQASAEDLDRLIEGVVAESPAVFEFALLDELIRRGDRERILHLISSADWGLPGWGMSWNSDLEARLARADWGGPPFEGLDLLISAAETTQSRIVRESLLTRIQYAFGASVLAGVPPNRVPDVARAWLNDHRERIEINPEYLRFIDMSALHTPFDSDQAEAAIRLRSQSNR
jgi:hypothetical protein